MAWERWLLCEVYRGQPWGVFLHIRKQTWLCHPCFFLVPVCFTDSGYVLGNRVVSESGKPQDALEFWKTQFCPGCILSKQISNLSTPALRISYATESLLEQSPGTHWYSTACQHPDVRTVSCWPVLKSKWGEKKNQSLIMEQWCLTLWHDHFFFFYLFVLGMGTGRDVFQGDTRTNTHTHFCLSFNNSWWWKLSQHILQTLSRLVLGRSFCFIFTLALIYGNSKPLDSLNNRIGLGQPLATLPIHLLNSC